MKTFELGGHQVELQWIGPTAHARIGDRTLIAKSSDVHAATGAVFEFERIRGSLRRASRRRVAIEWNDRQWVGEIRRRSGIRVIDESGGTVAVVGPFRLRTSGELTEVDVAVVLSIVLHQLDLKEGPAWFAFAGALLPLPSGWPRPIPGSRWSRRRG